MKRKEYTPDIEPTEPLPQSDMRRNNGCFGIGNVSAFLSLLNVVKGDNECKFLFDFKKHRILLEASLLSGVACVSASLSAAHEPDSILLPLATDQPYPENIVVIVPSSAMCRVLTTLVHIQCDRIVIIPSDVDIQFDVLYKNRLKSQCTIRAFDAVDQQDLFQFMIIQSLDIQYTLTVTRNANTIMAYIPVSMTTDCELHIVVDRQQPYIYWETESTVTKIRLLMPITLHEQRDPQMSLRCTLLPDVVKIIRNVLKFTKHTNIQLSLSDTYPVQLSTDPIYGVCIRAFFGTKVET